MPVVLAIPFEAPDVTWAASLAVIPIIIHLLMRSKPRLVVFPALRFVRMTHNANVARHRLKHLLLLLMRMGAVALLAVALARPKLESSANLSLQSAEPASAVVILDTSGSMAYRIGGQPRLEDAKRLAVDLLKGLPDGSEVGLLWPDWPDKDVKLVGRDKVIEQIQSLSDARGKVPDPHVPSLRPCQRARMGSLLGKAYASLAVARHGRREIYVFNDCTRDSWADVPPRRFVKSEIKTEQGHEHIRVYLFDVSAPENRDFLLADARWPAHPVSTRQSPSITVMVHNGQLPDKRTVDAEVGGSPGGRGRAEVELPAPNLTVQQRITKIAPQDAGLHTARVSLDCKDEILEDNDRYLVLEVGALPLVLMIESERVADRTGRTIGDLVEATLAPPRMITEESSLVKLERVGSSEAAKLVAEAAGSKKLNEAHAVILADCRVLGKEVWSALASYVSGGGTLIVLAGPNTNPEQFDLPEALAVLPIPGLKRKVQLDPGTKAAFPPFDKRISRVLDVYRENAAAPRIDRERVMQYFALADKPLPTGAVPLIWLSGEPPAPLLLERPLGQGRSLLLTTAGLGDWSEWSQASTMPALFYSMTLAYPRRQQRAWHFTLDEPATVTTPPEYRAGAAEVELPDGRGTFKVLINSSTGAMAVPTRYVGHYKLTLHAGGRADETVLYAVNFDPDEYALERMDPAGLEASFPPDRFRVVSGRGDAATDSRRPQEVGPLIGLALLLLLIGESFFSNRFYRQPTQSVTPAPTMPVAAEPVES